MIGPNTRTGSTIENSFRLRTPEAYDYGVMDDRVIRRWWTKLRHILASELSQTFKHARYTPLELAGCYPSASILREAVREAHLKSAGDCRSAILSGLLDEDTLTNGYDRFSSPQVHVSVFEASDRFDPFSAQRLEDASRCQRCLSRKLRPGYRGLVAYACLLIALGEPVPEDIAKDLVETIAEELDCLPLAEEFSGYDSWTLRSDHLRVFGAYVDPQKRQLRTDVFDHPSRTAWHPDRPCNMASPDLWRDACGRDLDGFLLTPLGRDRIPNARMAARQSPSFGAICHERPTLIVWEDRGKDEKSTERFTDAFTLVSLIVPGAHVWGPRLSLEAAARVTLFVEANAGTLLDHYSHEIDSIDLQRSLK